MGGLATAPAADLEADWGIAHARCAHLHTGAGMCAALALDVSGFKLTFAAAEGGSKGAAGFAGSCPHLARRTRDGRGGLAREEPRIGSDFPGKEPFMRDPQRHENYGVWHSDMPGRPHAL